MSCSQGVDKLRQSKRTLILHGRDVWIRNIFTREDPRPLTTTSPLVNSNRRMLYQTLLLCHHIYTQYLYITPSLTSRATFHASLVSPMLALWLSLFRPTGAFIMKPVTIFKADNEPHYISTLFRLCWVHFYHLGHHTLVNFCHPFTNSKPWTPSMCMT